MSDKIDPITLAVPCLSSEELRRRIDRLLNVDRPRFRRLWLYYRNPMRTRSVPADEQGSERPYRLAQEWGLPSRITGVRSGGSLFVEDAVPGVARKEVVIENDIAWRIETMLDYLAGKVPVIESLAADETRRGQINRLLQLILRHNGGITFLQQLALLGSVYGFVDVLVKFDPDPRGPSAAECERLTSDGRPPSFSAPLSAPAAPAPGEDDPAHPEAVSPAHTDDALERIARHVRLEIVEPARALPLLSPVDPRVVLAYVLCYELHDRPAKQGPSQKRRGMIARTFDRLRLTSPLSDHERRETTVILHIITATRWQRYEDDVLVAEGENSLGEIPLVHIQNIPQPFEYSGASDVEPLIPLQDELNTRLSDRANRIALQSARMYLGKGIDGFTEMPVQPGRMWETDNDQADVIEFGGESGSPSEDNHIRDLREAMDKTSGVSPIAAGVVKGRIGQLTSAAALRVTLMALLAKTEKKRTTYGEGIARLCELSLAWLNRAGLFRTDPHERRVSIHWPSPLPDNTLERLREAGLKSRLGIPKELVLRELGYELKSE